MCDLCRLATVQSNIHDIHHVYRAMHFSANHGLVIACHLSVCLSVCDFGGS